MKLIISLGPWIQKGRDSFSHMGVVFLTHGDEQVVDTVKRLSKEMQCDLFVVEGKIFSAKEITCGEE